MAESMAGWIAVAIPMAALIFTIYNAASSERALWWKARADVTHFCRELSDRMDEIIITASFPLKESVNRPPIPTSMLSYLRDCLDSDVDRCLSAWSQRHTAHPYQIAPQLRYRSAQIHVEWERLTGHHVASIQIRNLPPYDSNETDCAIDQFKWTAELIRTRATLLHQEINGARPANRFTAFARMHFSKSETQKYEDSSENKGKWHISDLLG